MTSPRGARARGAAALAALLLGLGRCDRLRPDGRWREAVRRATEPAVPAAPPSGPLRWARRLALPPGFPQVCDLASTPSGLVLAASADALGVDGAAVFRARGERLETLLTWDGQGFLRVHAYGDTLLVPDADAPFRALAFLTDLDVDGYVFVSSPTGTLSRQGRELLPAVYHVFDTARLRDGRAVASTGAYLPARVPYVSEGAPAALFLDEGPGRPWRRACVFPAEASPGVYRYTWLLTLPDGALLAGTEGPSGPGAVRFEDPTRGCANTTVQGLGGYVLRWASQGEQVLAVTQGSTSTHLWCSRDGGRRFEPYPGAPSMPQSVARVDGGWLLLAGGALWSLGDDGAVTERAPSEPRLGPAPSSLVSAPLALHGGSVWAGSTTTGEVFEAVPR
ncbi:MAG: hypothetical protein HY909_14815 [Deltaproteobacteria bacterium]|nr:hypothetical protein [Deltaproteobacteria bacterium]